MTSTFDTVNPRYDITIAGESYNLNNYVTTVTTTPGGIPLDRDDAVQWAAPSDQDLQPSGTAVQSGFGFVIYKP